jgi:hypothetical protein
MIEITMTEALLLLWAVVATAAYFHTKEIELKQKLLMRMFVEDEDLRKQVLDAHAQFMKERQRG